VKQQLAKGAHVRTMILAQEITDRIRYATIDSPFIELKEYEMNVLVKDASRVPTL
jgi:hypothetical protein